MVIVVIVVAAFVELEPLLFGRDVGLPGRCLFKCLRGSGGGCGAGEHLDDLFEVGGVGLDEGCWVRVVWVRSGGSGSIIVVVVCRRYVVVIMVILSFLWGFREVLH